MDVPEYELTKVEMLRLEWLMHTAIGIESAEKLFQRDEQAILHEDGMRSERVVEWNAVIRHVFPHLIVIMLRSPFLRENKGKLDFFEHPRYVVFPRTGEVLDLYAERRVRLVDDDPGAQDEMSSTLNHLSNLISEIETSRKGEAMKAFRTLLRVLGMKP